MSDDISVIIPEPVVAKIRGEAIEIRQLKVGQLPKVVRLLHPMYEQLKAIKDKDAQDAKEKKESSYAVDFYSLVMQHADSVLELVALLSNKDRNWVDDLEIDELVAIFSAIVEVNIDFFIRRVLPSLSVLVTGVVNQAKILGAGQTLSKV